MLQRRVPAALIDRTQAAMWSHAADLRRAADQTSLVHGDFGGRNLIVRQVAGRWVAAAVLDWEFALSGSPLADVGHFLRGVAAPGFFGETVRAFPPDLWIPLQHEPTIAGDGSLLHGIA